MTAAVDPVAPAFAWCRALVKREARNFYHGLRLLPDPERAGLYAIYAWMRAVDDLADAPIVPGRETLDDRRASLESMRERTHAVFASHAAPRGESSPMWEALAGCTISWPLDLDDFDRMIDVQLRDLEPLAFEHFDELRDYCDGAASTVGRICLRIWGVADDAALDERALALASDRGIAFQLTNILRDVREDAARDRCYLPASELRAAGLDLDGLLAWSDESACRRFVAEQTARARRYYDASAPLDAITAPAARPTLWAMTRIYAGILERIEHDPTLVASRRRARLSTFTKALIAWRARRLGPDVAGATA